MSQQRLVDVPPVSRPKKRERIYERIDVERNRQAMIWDREHTWGHGDCSSRDVDDIVKASVLSEECGEVATAVLEKDKADLKLELIQVAAVAVAWLEAL